MVLHADPETSLFSSPATTTIAPAALMTRSQVVERIISINPTATTEFLGRFADRALRGYLDHLNVVQEPRGRSSQPWVRPADSPAILMRAPND